jgi:hypothetical protein
MLLNAAISSCSMELLVCTLNFNFLAINVTASYGVAYLLEELAEESHKLELLKYFWTSLLYTYVAQRCPPLEKQEQSTDLYVTVRAKS